METMQLDQNIKDIKLGMEKHNEDDIRHFTDIKGKLDANHDVHIRNEGTLKSILAEATKTNGRVTSLENFIAKLDKSYSLLEQSNANLAIIVSQQHNQYETWVAQQERLHKDEMVTKSDFQLVRNIVFGMTGTILLTVLAALLSLIINK